MTPVEKSEIPWRSIGGPLADLLRYERGIGHYEHASHDLLLTIVHGTTNSNWRQFLLERDSFAATVRQVVAISNGDPANPKAVLDSIRELVEVVCVGQPETATSFLVEYLKQRPLFPAPVRQRLDRRARAGNLATPLLAATFASEMDRLQPLGTYQKAVTEVSEHWYEQILQGRLPSQQARKIPAKLLAAKDDLRDHLREVEEDHHMDDHSVYERYSPLFKSCRISEVTGIIIAMHRFGLIRQIQGKFGVEHIEMFLESFSPEEVMRRFERLEGWIGQYHKTNHDGTVLTPALIKVLSQEADFESLLAELDRLREATRNGRFDFGNVLQKDLEFRRFEYEYTRILEPLAYDLRGRYPAPLSTEELYRRFNELEELPPQGKEAFELNGEQRAEAGRAAYEAANFLEFLREFRGRTSRSIVVVGNDRFGRQWIVEPIEEYISDGFSVRYDRVRSGTSMRLSVPSPFPREFVNEISEHMPHIVIVDGCHAPAESDVMALSRALRDYGNWVMAFNDIRAKGDGSRYEHKSVFPTNHLAALKKWHEFTSVRENLTDWVTPGPTYRMALWAPELKDVVVMGDEKMPCNHEVIEGDRPLVVLANPIFYRTEGDDLPRVLRGTTPRYFDDPDHHVQDSVVFGFGPHGLETRLKGTSTEKFVRTVQQHIKAEIRLRLKHSTGLKA